MKIAYVTTYDARNPRNWSGLGYHIARSLEIAGCELEYIGPLQERYSSWFRAKTLLYRKLKHQAFQRDREPAILDGYAMQVAERLRQSSAQIVFSPGTVPIAHLQTDRPIVFWTDATYAAVQEAYKWELPAAPISLEHGHAMEQRAIDRAALAIYSSQWAADSAITRYHADANKVKVVPFGANIEENRTIEDVRAMIAARQRDVCKLLFIGVGWERKGGDIAIEVARLLNEMGVKTQLTIAGSLPPAPASSSGEIKTRTHLVSNPDVFGPYFPKEKKTRTRLVSDLPFLNAIGFIDKSVATGRERFESLLATSHFLILPARAEAFGLVLCEGNSFGLPAIATNVGGIPTIVRDGVNGHLFPPEDPQTIATGIARAFSDWQSYARLAESSFVEYQSRLNWRVAGQAVRKLLESL